jgi:spore maturation protein CgeB
MKRPAEWRNELAGLASDPRLELLPGRGGLPTLKIGDALLHSQYRPVEEAERLIESAQLDLERPILVLGLGLGYHVQALHSRGADVAAIEFDPGIVRLACEHALRDSTTPIALGNKNELLRDPELLAFLERAPQILVHPPSANAHGEAFAELEKAIVEHTLGQRRLSIVVVGPMYGGSQPIAMYLHRAFESLGHRTLFVDTSTAWPLYESMRASVKTKSAQDQLADLLVNWTSQWAYARVAEFTADICIVLAQAPVGREFPVRLAKDGVVMAYWFVENWRHMAYWRQIAPLYDGFFHIQPGDFEQALESIGCTNHAYVQTACDPELHKPVELTTHEQKRYGADVSFAGAGYYNRTQLFQGLTDYDFAIWGVDWGIRELNAHVRDPDKRFTHETFCKIAAATKINLNLHSSTTHPGVNPDCDAINPRVFEIAACGAFQLCDPAKGLDTLFDPERELPVYRDLAELRAKLDYFLEHEDERREIAVRARARALRDHTYVHRAKQMLAFLVERHGTRILKKGVIKQHTCAEMVERVGRDTDLGRYLSTLPPETPFTQETINGQLTTARTKLTHAEKVFVFLREMRAAAERLLAAQP